jgi:positive regulator of sigma E activity
VTNEQIKKIIEDSYEDSKEETLRSMAGDFYSRRMLSTAILVYVWVIVFIALAAYSAMQFFKADQTQGQIMYAALFILGAHGVGLMKICAWEMIHRHSIKRDLRRLELRVAELSEMLKSK